MKKLFKKIISEFIHFCYWVKKKKKILFFHFLYKNIKQKNFLFILLKKKLKRKNKFHLKQ
jgi:hypothetical protein